MATVLVVDDNRLNRSLVRAVLRLAGHVVVEAEDAESARDAWRQRPLDLVLMDIRLADIGGDELTRELRADGHDELVVVAFSADVVGELAKRFSDAGFDGFMSKPIDVIEFPAQIEALIAAGRRRSNE